MKKNKSLFMFPSVFVFLFVSLYPIFRILVDIKKIENVYFSLGSIVALLLFILLCIIVFIEEIYLLYYLYTKMNVSIIKKILWTVLLLLFNVLIIPYFYMKKVTNENKIVLKSLLYLIPIIVLIFVFSFGLNTYNEQVNKIKEERKRIEAERNIYNTKDNIVSFTFRHGYKKQDIGEYDLYVKNNEKNIVFTAYTYDTTLYEQTTPDQFITKGISDINKEKEKFDVYKQKEVKELDDKTINIVEYKGKTKDSSMCIYRIIVITYKNKPNYLVYIVEVITENNYNLYKKELNEIIDTSKLK